MILVPEITIVETCPWHLREMAETMTADSVEVAHRLGFTPLKALWQSYRGSIICKSAFINGKIAAIFGLSGVMFGDTGRPWLILTPETREHPFRVAFIYRKELNKMQEMFPILEDWVPADNEASIRMMELMGFKVSRNEIKVADGVFRKAERRRK